MSGERVRIGLVIRQPSAAFSLNGPFTVRDESGKEQTLDLSRMQWVSVRTDSPEPLWSARLHSFYDRKKAERLAEAFRSHGAQAEVRTLGRPAVWGAVGALAAGKHAVLLGKGRDQQALAREIEDLWRVLPVQDIPGGKKFEEELPRFDFVREVSAGGGELVLVDGESGEKQVFPSPLVLTPLNEEECRFTLGGVRIGIDFHWDHEEDLAFRGSLEIHVDGNNLTLINELDLEDYLASVLGSEMRSDWPEQALAAQAVAARSTVLATRGSHHGGELFDLCHDDHCQDYQGAGRESETSRKALHQTGGWLLASRGRVVDARFAKTCSGIVERYDAVWDDEAVDYLQPVACCASGTSEEARELIGLGESGRGEEVLRRLLESPPEWAACNPSKGHYPASVEEMKQLYRWRRELADDELSVLVRERTNRDIGAITALEPLEWGVSGRIVRLRVIGERGEVVVSKELAIRRLLSESHLPSSAFTVQHENGRWVLEGIGWGHGVGMCQFGASTMAAKGWNAENILLHYYPGAEILRRE